MHDQQKELIEKLSEDLKDMIYDNFLDKVTPEASRRVQEYYRLTEQDIIDAQEKLIQGVDECTPFQLLIEQAFVGLQVELLKDVAIQALSKM
jgi:hypothetical protein